MTTTTNNTTTNTTTTATNQVVLNFIYNLHQLVESVDNNSARFSETYSEIVGTISDCREFLCRRVGLTHPDNWYMSPEVIDEIFDIISSKKNIEELFEKALMDEYTGHQI